MNALATGRYECVLLWAELKPGRNSYRLDFVLTNGERHSAMLQKRKLSLVLVGLGFERWLVKGVERWAPRDPEADQPVVMLELKFSPKYENNEAVLARATGKTLKCDIRKVDESKLGYEEF